MKDKNHYGESLSGESVNRKKYSLLHLFTYSPIHLFTQKGFSLIEILMIILIVSIALPALLILIGGEAGRGVESELRVTATNVAKQLMEDMKQKCWDENSVSGGICRQTATPSATLEPDIGETALSLYDDIDDFNDLLGASCTDTVTVNNVTFTRAVQVCYVNASALNTCVDSAGAGCTRTIGTGTQYKKITVTITAPGTNWNSSVVLTTVMTNY